MSWTGIPTDILNEIARHLECYRDYVRCRAVCKLWKLALPRVPRDQRHFQIPYLLLPFEDETQTTCSLLSILENKVYHLKLPECQGKLFRGSNYGWLVTLEKGPDLNLLNPLTRAKISLPPISSFPDMVGYNPVSEEEYSIKNKKNGEVYTYDKTHIQKAYIDKVILHSSSPFSLEKDDDFMAVAIYGAFSSLAYCRRGDNRWTEISTSYGCIADSIFHEGKLYAIHCNGRLGVVNDVRQPLLEEVQVEPPSFSATVPSLYLVSSIHGLLLVARDIEQTWHAPMNDSRFELCHSRTISFDIYKLVYSFNEKPKWLKMKSIEDQVLLVGLNKSSLVSCNNFPKSKGNCIYFTDDILESHYTGITGGLDIGFFQLEDSNIHRIGGYTLDGELISPTPVWLLSNPIS